MKTKIKLTYEEWCEKYAAPVDENVAKEIKELHNVDLYTEVEKYRKFGYDQYLHRIGHAK